MHDERRRPGGRQVVRVPRVRPDQAAIATRSARVVNTTPHPAHGSSEGTRTSGKAMAFTGGLEARLAKKRSFPSRVQEETVVSQA